MENRIRSVSACLLIVSLLVTVLYPQDLWGGVFDFDEDTLKTTGIIIGITFGACLAIVLIAGTLKDLKGEPEDIFAHLPIQQPPGPWKDLLSLKRKDPDPLACLQGNDPRDVIAMGSSWGDQEALKDPLREGRLSFLGRTTGISPYPFTAMERTQTISIRLSRTLPFRLCKGLPWTESNTSFHF